jgi:hypothetical protein
MQSPSHLRIPRVRHALITDCRQLKINGNGLEWHNVPNKFREYRSPGSNVQKESWLNMATELSRRLSWPEEGEKGLNRIKSSTQRS